MSLPIFWAVVASRSGARIFQNRTDRLDFFVLVELAFPAGRLRNREYDADRPGRVRNPASRAMKHGLDPEQYPDARFAEEFAILIAENLYKGWTHQEFQRLILVAEPSFMGLLREKVLARKAGLAESLYLEVCDGWSGASESEVSARLRERVRQRLSEDPAA